LVFQLRSVMLGDIGSRVPIFRCADPEYIRCVIVKLKYQFYLATDLVYHHGELDQRMFLLMKGKVSLSNRASQILTVLVSGAHFGEAAVLAAQHRRPMTARAVIYSDCCTISRQDLDEIHHEFPDRRVLLAAISERRQSHISKETYFNDDMVVENALLKHDATSSPQLANGIHRFESSGVPIKFFASELNNINLRRNISMDRTVLQKREAIALVQGFDSNLMAVNRLRTTGQDISTAWRRRSATVMQLGWLKNRVVHDPTLGIVP